MELIKCTENYWEFMREIRTHPENQKWFYTQPIISEDQQRQYMKNNADKYKICIDDELPVGYVGIINDNEITYCVHPNYKGKGVGTYMVSEMIKHHNKLIAFVIPNNIASNKVFEKLGFTKQIFYTYEKEKK